jgi:hypothetical protein
MACTMAEQVDVDIAAHNAQVVPCSIQHDALGRGLPCPVVGVHPWALGDVETNCRNINIVIAVDDGRN